MWQGLHVAAATVFIGVFIGMPVPAGAVATLPSFDGAMVFPSIQGPSGPEEFSWEVVLGMEQSLGSIDSQQAEVVYDHGPRALLIEAGGAHDALGATVPTSLAVSDGNVITLEVHHRAGNPAAGGAPFVYPVNAGAGWIVTDEGVTIIDGPPDEADMALKRGVSTRITAPSDDPPQCWVPKLAGRTLAASKRRLRNSDCRIGHVNRRKGASLRNGRVVSQNPKAGTVLAEGSRVGVTLAE